MTKREEIVNGNMANSMEELRLLGKQMENMRDEQQLEETNRIADPQQFDDEEEGD
ncbi:multidrug ABC transporter ATPase [Solibacillus sp. FSL R7-0668]|uniref:multidrug ABC transporter ATPase n=1 Tax=Solibacillus sp. FSL R7-0668 TaxID=2921688 RepID=UPI002F6F9440